MEEIAKQIMSINGTDIESAKTKAGQATEKLQTELDNSKLELKAKEELITSVNSEIEKFKGMNIEEIQKQVETLKTQNTEYQTKSEADKVAYEKQLADKDYEFAVKEFVSGHKFTNDFVKDAFVNDFKSKGLKLEDGKFLGADDHVKNFMEKNPGVFAVETTTENKIPEIVKGTGGQQTQTTGNGFGFNFTPIHQRPVEK